ncbi:MAG: fumarate hydratase [Elusimicrobiales bacterium]
MKKLYLPDLSVLAKAVKSAEFAKAGDVRVDGGSVRVSARSLRALAKAAVAQAQFFLPRGYLRELSHISADRRASSGDKFAAAMLLENAAVAAEGRLPLCQDTGTVIIRALKGERVITGADDAQYLALGARDAYIEGDFRFSQMLPGPRGEKNSGDNMPVEAEILAVPGAEYLLAFIIKGGGSSNRTEFHAKPGYFLSGGRLEEFLASRIAALGAQACPPYSLGFAAGGTSPELCVKTASLAASGLLDFLPHKPCAMFRDAALEKRLLAAAEKTGAGAQFGGKYQAHSVRAVRMSRHGASLFIAMAVSCCAPRMVLAKINRRGIWLERRAQLPPGRTELIEKFSRLKLNLDLPARELLRSLDGVPAGTRVFLSGHAIAARDLAHAGFAALLQSGKKPDYLRYPIYYAGPCRTPRGLACGSFGPTTSSRMDDYMPVLLSAGAGLVTIGKGARGPQARAAIKRAGGVYFSAMGGAAAVTARRFITESRVIDFPELGMEAVRLLRFENLPAVLSIART